jgi:hypothetical protein
MHMGVLPGFFQSAPRWRQWRRECVLGRFGGLARQAAAGAVKKPAEMPPARLVARLTG